MSCIVADSGPLIALAGGGLLHLPSALFGKACITQIVLVECTQKRTREDANRILQAVSENMLFLMPDPIAPELVRTCIISTSGCFRIGWCRAGRAPEHAANRQAGKQRPAVTCCYRARERLDAQTGIGVADCSYSDPINPRILRKNPKSMLGRLTP